MVIVEVVIDQGPAPLYLTVAPPPPRVMLCSLALLRLSRRCEHNRFLRVMVTTHFLRLMVVTLSGAVLDAHFLQKELAFCD